MDPLRTRTARARQLNNLTIPLHVRCCLISLTPKGPRKAYSAIAIAIALRRDGPLPRTLLHEMYEPWQPVLLGGMVERLRRRAAAAHARVHGEMPAEVDAPRFGVRYTATDPGAWLRCTQSSPRICLPPRSCFTAA